MPDPLRVLITADAARTADSAAVPHAYATQVEFLQGTGNHVHLFGVDDRTSPRGILRNLRELQQVADSFKPHLIVTYYGTMVAAISRMAAGRIPLVVTFRGSDLQGTSNLGWKWRLRDWLGRCLSLWAAFGARQIIVNGSGLLGELPDHLRAKAHNLPNGVDTGIFAPLHQEQARRRSNRSLDEKLILFNAGVGSGQVVKNRPLAEEVLSLVKTYMPSVKLEIISTCSREEVALLMNVCDCLLVTSLHEGSPDLVKEAMACNLPVVSVPCGDVRERLRGVLLSSIQPYDAKALAKALEEVLCAGQRSNGREQLFLQGLDISSVTQRVLSIYRLAVAG
jgi:glycosyltransferase involved in cell wall biosynthesis